MNKKQTTDDTEKMDFHGYVQNYSQAVANDNHYRGTVDFKPAKFLCE